MVDSMLCIELSYESLSSLSFVVIALVVVGTNAILMVVTSVSSIMFVVVMYYVFVVAVCYWLHTHD